jgi:putative endonuclease
MFYVYMLASKPYGTLYIGTTSDLARRIWEHKNEVVPGFTKRFGVDQLVWFEAHQSRDAALQRERQIKEWKRNWKISLIEHENRHWRDLSLTLTCDEVHPGEGRDPWRKWAPAFAGVVRSCSTAGIGGMTSAFPPYRSLMPRASITR